MNLKDKIKKLIENANGQVEGLALDKWDEMNVKQIIQSLNYELMVLAEKYHQEKGEE